MGRVDLCPVVYRGPYGGDYTTIRLAGVLAEQCGGYQAPPIA